MKDVYLEEYTAPENVRKYVSKTAGTGIEYVLNHYYGPLYTKILDEMAPGKVAAKQGFRVLEYGCGGAMNLLWILRYMLDRKMPIDLACGTDFAQSMVDASYQEYNATGLAAQTPQKVSFHPVANQNLARELPAALGRPPAEVLGSFDLFVGVNTYRYCFRVGKQFETAQDIAALLRPGGYSVMIEMNHHFPFFRSKFRNQHLPAEQTYLPTLEEYETVFRKAGLEIVTSRTFCWIPHSANPGMTGLIRFFSPVLDLLFPRRAIRSLIIARRPQ